MHQAVLLSRMFPRLCVVLIEQTGKEVIERDGIASSNIASLSEDLTNGVGFDDIVVLSPLSAERVGEIAKVIARRGTLNMVGDIPLDGLVQVDVGRLHYDYIAFVGTDEPEISSAYGEERNRCELRKEEQQFSLALVGQWARCMCNEPLRCQAAHRRSLPPR